MSFHSSAAAGYHRSGDSSTTEPDCLMGLGTEISRTKASYVMEASLLHHLKTKKQRAEKRKGGLICIFFFMRNYLHNSEPTHPVMVLIYLGTQNQCGPVLSHQVQSLKVATLSIEFPMEAFLNRHNCCSGEPFTSFETVVEIAA